MFTGATYQDLQLFLLLMPENSFFKVDED